MLTRYKFTIHMRMLFTTLVCVYAISANAACVRYQKPSNSPLGYDGPGSFGELEDTVTLDCLKYVGSISKNGKELVLIQDETGQVHRLKVGSYMGEHSGVIIKIDNDAIYIKQMIRRNGAWDEVIVKFNKSSKP
jgi:Tfp pilus assembly protein PilP